MVSKQEVIKKLKSVKDPELNIDIYTLGLIYEIEIMSSEVRIKMTFTFPGCPYGPWLIEEVNEKIKSIKNVKKVNVSLTFNPPWKPSEELKEVLGL